MGTWTPLDVGLLVAFNAAMGIAIGQAVTVARLRREAAAKDASGLRWHQRHAEVREELETLREEVAELGYVLLDAQRRWGFDFVGRWPKVAWIVGEVSEHASSRFLIEWAPGIGGLRESGRATDRVA